MHRGDSRAVLGGIWWQPLAGHLVSLLVDPSMGTEACQVPQDLGGQALVTRPSNVSFARTLGSSSPFLDGVSDTLVLPPWALNFLNFIIAILSELKVPPPNFQDTQWPLCTEHRRTEAKL